MTRFRHGVAHMVIDIGLKFWTFNNMVPGCGDGPLDLTSLPILYMWCPRLLKDVIGIRHKAADGEVMQLSCHHAAIILLNWLPLPDLLLHA